MKKHVFLLFMAVSAIATSVAQQPPETPPEQVFYMRHDKNGILRAVPPGEISRSFSVTLEVNWIDNLYNPVGDNTSQIVLHKDSLRIFPANVKCPTLETQNYVFFNSKQQLQFTVEGNLPDSIHLQMRCAYATDAQTAVNPAEWQEFLGKKPKYFTVQIVEKEAVQTTDPLALAALEARNNELNDKIQELYNRLNNTPVKTVYRSGPLIHVFQPVFENNIQDFDTLDDNFQHLIEAAYQELENIQNDKGDPDNIMLLKNELMRFSEDYNNVVQLQDTAYVAYEENLKNRYGPVPVIDSLHNDFDLREDTVADLKKEAEDVISKLIIPPKPEEKQAGSGFSLCEGWWCWLWILVLILSVIVYVQHRKIKKLKSQQMVS